MIYERAVSPRQIALENAQRLIGGARAKATFPVDGSMIGRQKGAMKFVIDVSCASVYSRLPRPFQGRVRLGLEARTSNGVAWLLADSGTIFDDARVLIAATSECPMGSRPIQPGQKD
jgi:hypothetical protein